MTSHPRGTRATRPRVSNDGAVVTIAMDGVLDRDAGDGLLHAAAGALDDAPIRMDVDLCGLTDFTSEGASALVACRELCAGLPDGLHYLTSEGPGRDALLGAFDEHADTRDPA